MFDEMDAASAYFLLSQSNSSTPIQPPALLLEDGTNLLLEDGTFLLLEEGT